jgi:hypothetical protein
MKMSELTDFLVSLNALGVMFSDEISKPRQRLYWEALKDIITLEEWNYATLAAIRRETFHKVPLPARLMEYVDEYRAHQERRRWEEQRLVAQAERLALESSPEWHAEQAKKQAEREEHQQEYQAWLLEQPKTVLIALGKLNPPHPERWAALEGDTLDYQQSNDPDEARTRLRNQLRQLMAND